MEKIQRKSLVDYQNFIVATRDSGYKSTPSALAELIDNAIEAGATKIDILIHTLREDGDTAYEIFVVDNGKGMDASELSLALQFGGSSRFNSRTGLGRYGMGLPNSSLSQCRRVEVTTWKKKGEFLVSYLDIDEVIDQKMTHLPNIKNTKAPPVDVASKSGTVVRWIKCDRLSFRYQKSIVKQIHFIIGKIFRYAIWQGVEIRIGEEVIQAFDPLFIGNGRNMTGGKPYGEDLMYRVKAPDTGKLADVRVRFIELPIDKWANLTNEEKRKQLISKRAGVTVLRADREIDYGWFFMGDKRRENYDDWWRCEISFPPQLDELFGVTHTKQEIKEVDFMTRILTPDIEQTARILNNRVRQKFIRLKVQQPTVYAKNQLERTDVYLPGIKKNTKRLPVKIQAGDKVLGFKYRILTKELQHDLFFDVVERNDTIILLVNTNHMFYDKIFKSLHDQRVTSTAGFIKILELLLFSAARAEFAFAGKGQADFLHRFKQQWSAHLKTVIS
jgi:hypothetical protein